MEFEVLDTNQLQLRRFDQDALDFAFTNLEDAEHLQFLGLNDVQALAEEKRRYKGGYSTFNKSFLYFHLILKERNEVIGWCGFHTWYTDHHRAEIGYGIYKDEFKKQGFMTEALEAVLEYGFENMKLNRVEALIAEYNIPSLKLLQRFNFQKEGVLRAHYYVDGIAEDSSMYALLSEDWAAKALN